MGVDPDPDRLWPSSGGGEGTVAAVEAHCQAFLEAVAPAAVGVKFQLACFERLGGEGFFVLRRLVGRAKGLGLFVIADGKRGDVPHSARAYAAALFGSEGLAVDGATVNPYFGKEGIAPFLEAAGSVGGAVFVVVRSSNRGAEDLQEVLLADGSLLWERVVLLLRELAVDLPAGPLAGVGAVVGATAPAVLTRARELLPRTPFLVPGVGAQGGVPAALGGALASLPEPARRASLLVTAARALERAYEREGGTPAQAARAAAERLRGEVWALC